MFLVGIGLLTQERSIFSKGEEMDEEENSGGVTASCSLDEAEVEHSWKRVILAEVHLYSILSREQLSPSANDYYHLPS